jgi:hypothetical protein
MKNLEKLKKKRDKLRFELIKRLSVEDFKLLLKFEMVEFDISLIENRKSKEKAIKILNGN